jgi:1-acyl-sn-glycerol-3-phosphate acyltransferase
MDRWKSCVPVIDEQYTHQAKLQDLSDEEFAKQCKQIEFKWYHRLFQIACFIVFLGPLRLLIFGISGAFCIFLVIFIRLSLRYLGIHPDLCRSLCTEIARLGFRLFFLSIGNVWIRVNGKMDHSVRFVIGNHLTILDGFLIATLRNVTIVLQKKWVSNFLSRTFFDTTHPVYIGHRHRGNTKEIIDRADDTSEPPVMIFPEGTSTNGEILLQFHRTAFLTPYKVQPMLIRYWMPFVPKGWNTIAYVRQSALSYIWQLISMPLFIIEVDCLQPIAMEVEGKADIDTFTRNAQIIVANHLKIKAVSRTSEQVAEVLSRRPKTC